MRPRVCFDIDQVIATGTVEEVYSDAAGWAFDKCEPITETIKIIEELGRRGVEIYLHSARYECDREKTVQWLKQHAVHYDKLVLDKPMADLYVDDKNYPEPYIPDWPDNLGEILWRLNQGTCKRTRDEP